MSGPNPKLATLLAVTVAAAALAGPPLLTDDPDTLPKGDFELNTAYTLSVSARDSTGSRTWEHEAPLFDLNFGLTDGVQVKFEMPLLILEDAEGSRAGIGDLSLGAKLRLCSETEWALSLSTYPAVGVPLGSRERGLGTGSPSLTLPLQAGRHFLKDKLFLYADLGYQEQLAHGETDLWYAGIAAEYKLTAGLTLCGEVRYELAVNADDDSLFNFGLKWSLTEYAALIAAAGRSFAPTESSGADFRLYLGVQWSF
jgi:hypothetical protein